MPNSPSIGKFRDRSAYTTIVGPDCRLPSTRLLIGLFIVDPGIHYPPHAHSAQELYLPLSGTALYARGDGLPREEAPGTFIFHKAWEQHMMWSGPDPVLILWVWLGDLDGGYRMLEASAT